MTTIAMSVVLLAALFLIGLALASFFAPLSAARFLDGFASTARAHIAEMTIRLLVGAALIQCAPGMALSDFHRLLGWVLIATSIVLLIIPWRVHHRFARAVVPPLTRRVWVFGLLSLPLGIVTFFAVLAGARI